MKRLLRLPGLLRFTLVFLIALVFQNCSEQKIKESTDETLNITEYLRDTPDYSMFLEALEITNYASFMNTYGTYTLFLPTNDAVNAYLKDVGANSLKEVPLADLQNVVKLHILNQTINTTSFTDGKIATPSLYGQFLVTGATNKNGQSSITVNKQASILKSNVEVGNGVIHVIDKVLRVADKTLAKTIEQDTNLSLFTEALKITGWYDALDKPIDYTKNDIDSYLTVLAQTNDAFKAAGINNIEELKTKYSHLHEPLNPKDSLNLFVSYRILPKLQYLADVAISPALVTKAPLEVISAKLDKDVILLNEEVFNGVLEKGVAITREKSDVTASNGVLHIVGANFAIKKRLPAPVYFDFCDQNEFRQLTSVFRIPGAAPKTSLAKALFKDVTWDSNDPITYFKDAAKGGTVGFGWHGDCLEINRFRDGNCQNITFTTPVIIKGKYKLWISYRGQDTKVGLVKVFVDGVEMSRQINMLENGNKFSSIEERVLESQGYKRHIEPSSSKMNCRLVGTVDITTTGRHKLMLQSNNAFSAQAWFDVAEFRPVDMDQLYPKFNSGTSGFAPMK
ncbi:fasciclin domain-containing protein [Flavobacterium hibisci]|uniref:fasciclin domain-containing protein n=1 Tax=Flavobacterium hibisci TaxID=1914462 RepID=UPI001CBE5D45|nr:fasciclin domain-containing protein [Flavobacterium hibisci]MBZ4041391.1 fasciclin domain-containing protein [Flavobacterium hibisci]